jgi:hypothetical protein
VVEIRDWDLIRVNRPIQHPNWFGAIAEGRLRELDGR